MPKLCVRCKEREANGGCIYDPPNWLCMECVHEMDVDTHAHHGPDGGCDPRGRSALIIDGERWSSARQRSSPDPEKHFLERKSE